MHKIFYRSFSIVVLLSLVMVALPLQHAQAATLTAGNLVIYRVGTGSGSLVNTGNPVFLDEYTPSGTLVQSIALPTSVSGADYPLIASGTAISEGLLSRSADGRYLVLTGYGTTTGGGTSLSTTSGASVPRVVGRVDASGNMDTTTALSDFANGSTPRSATSSDGSVFWVAGGVGGVRHATLGNTTSNTLNSSFANVRQLAIFDGQLYASSGTGTDTFKGVETVGSGLPVSGTQTITRLPGLTDTTNPDTYAFFLADLSAGVSGVDTLYVADDGDTALTKFSLVSGNWVSNGTVGVNADNYRGLTGTVSGGVVTLFATRKGGSSATGGGELVMLVDSSGYNGSFSATPTLLASAASNTAFRGVALAPENPATPTPTVSPTETESPSPSPSPTGTMTGTLTETMTATPTATPTNTAEASATETPIPTYTATASETSTPTATETPSPSPSPTGTMTETMTVTPSETPIPTETTTSTHTAAPTETFTLTPTPSETLTPTETSIPTETESPSPSPSPSPTGTVTETMTATSTETPTATSTSTETPTPTETLTLTATITSTATDTATATYTATSTETPTETVTPTQTPTPTATSTATKTPAAFSMTFTSLTAQDGWVLETSENSNVGGMLNANAATFNLGDDTAKKQYRSILSFNTSVLPDNAVITAVTLKVQKQSVLGGGNPFAIFQGLLVDIRKGFFGSAATLQAADFQATANGMYGPFSPALASSIYSINLTGGKANINKLSSSSGLTQLRLRFKLDDNNNAVANSLSLYSGNAATANRPQLVIKYYIP